MAVASGPSSEASGEARFLANRQLIDSVIAYVCRRNHASAEEADDFASDVWVKLIEDNYTVLDKFEGRSSLRTFLTVVIQRLFLDHRTAAWGKWRPSAEAKRAGPLAVALEQLRHRDGHTFEEACEILQTERGVTRDAIESLAGRLPARTRRRLEDDTALAEVPSTLAAPDASVLEQEHESAASRVSSALRNAVRQLSPQDQLILAYHFEDGRTVADIASVLTLDQRALYRRLERLLRDLREALEAQGLDAAALEVFDSPAVTVASPFEHDAPPERKTFKLVRPSRGESERV